MASVPNPQTVTYEEWLRLPEVEDAIEEVVDGHIILMPPAKRRHARIAKRLLKAFDKYLDDQHYDVLDNNFGLVIRQSPLTTRVPDLAIFDLSTVVEKDGYFHSAPQFLAEVLSPANTRKEMQRKLADYAGIGVPEVWVISPEARTVEVLVLENASLRCVQIVSQGTLVPRHLPGVEIDVEAIWPD